MLKNLPAFICIALLLASCASQRPPTGGDKDIAPPQVVRESPKNLSVNFHSKKINLTFNEYIQLDDPGSQVFFSPAIEGKPSFHLRGKTLTIVLGDTLRPNTTYTISFGNAIKDITEGNIMLDFQYVFSTGTYIDSLRISGKVTGAFDGLPKENALVMLYESTEDSAVAKHRPDYNTRTSATGTFAISHIKAGTYQLVAIMDQDFNMLYGGGEEIAFEDSALTISDTTGYYELRMFKPRPQEQKIISAESHRLGNITIAFAKPVEKAIIKNVTFPDKATALEWNDERDTAQFWINDFNTDSIDLILSADELTDTLTAGMKTIESSQRVAKPKLTILSPFLGFNSAQKQEPGKPLVIKFSTPVTAINPNRKFKLLYDTTTIKTGAEIRLVKDSVTEITHAEIDYKWKEDAGYTCFIPDSMFADVFGNYNDTATLRFKTYAEGETGNFMMKLTIQDSTGHYFCRLETTGGELIGQRKLKPGSNEVNFENIRPGKYTFYAIEDRNQNNRWDSGDYWLHLQPEKIYRYTGDISMRENWDLELQMTIGVNALRQ